MAEEKMVMNMMMMVMMVAVIQLLFQPAEPEPIEPEPGVGQVVIGLANPPAGATKWQMLIASNDLSEGQNWGTQVQDNIADSAVFTIPEGWVFPLLVSIGIYQKVNGSQQLYYVQSFHALLYDWDVGDYVGDPDPDYRDISIPATGQYSYDVNAEGFIKMEQAG